MSLPTRTKDKCSVAVCCLTGGGGGGWSVGRETERREGGATLSNGMKVRGRLNGDGSAQIVVSVPFSRCLPSPAGNVQLSVRVVVVPRRRRRPGATTEEPSEGFTRANEEKIRCSGRSDEEEQEEEEEAEEEE